MTKIGPVMLSTRPRKKRLIIKPWYDLTSAVPLSKWAYQPIDLISRVRRMMADQIVTAPEMNLPT